MLNIICYQESTNENHHDIEWLDLKRLIIPSIAEDVKHLELSSVLVGTKIGTATLTKVRHTITRRSSNSTPRYLPPE